MFETKVSIPPNVMAELARLVAPAIIAAAKKKHPEAFHPKTQEREQKEVA